MSHGFSRRRAVTAGITAILIFLAIGVHLFSFGTFV